MEHHKPKKLIQQINTYFKENNFNVLKLPTILKDATGVLDSTTPERMKLFIALHEMVVLASSTGAKIQLDKYTKVSINSFSLMLSGSGTEKDKTVNTIKFIRAITTFTYFIYKRT